MRVSTVALAIATVVAAQDTYTATGVGCEPHDDHWHCPAGVAEPSTPPAAEATVDTVSATASGVCEPHDDHWHCPSGVAEPTFAPSAVAATTTAAGSITSAPAASASASHSHDDHDDEDDHDHAVTATTCEPHGDHWHCPSGVAEPTTAPAQTITSSRASSVSGAAASGSTSSTPAQATGAGSTIGTSHQGILAFVLGTVGALFL